jgi:conjugal transfer pilus assembly protein TraW
MKNKLVCALFIFASQMSFAKSLGVFGETFPVAEMSFLQFIELRLKKLINSTEMTNIQNQWIDEVRQYANRPGSLNMRSASRKYRFFYEPSLVLTKDIRDADGQLIYAKGTKVNALEKLPLYQPHWLFLDADESLQLAYAKRLITQYADLKIILTNGEIEKTSNLLSKEIFFDQGGKLTQKLGIKEIPAFVERKANKLLITIGVVDEKA